MIAVVGNIDAGVQGCLEHGNAVAAFNRSAIDDDSGHGLVY